VHQAAFVFSASTASGWLPGAGRAEAPWSPEPRNGRRRVGVDPWRCQRPSGALAPLSGGAGPFGRHGPGRRWEAPWVLAGGSPLRGVDHCGESLSAPAWLDPERVDSRRGPGSGGGPSWAQVRGLRLDTEPRCDEGCSGSALPESREEGIHPLRVPEEGALSRSARASARAARPKALRAPPHPGCALGATREKRLVVVLAGLLVKDRVVRGRHPAVPGEEGERGLSESWERLQRKGFSPPRRLPGWAAVAAARVGSSAPRASAAGSLAGALEISSAPRGSCAIQRAGPARANPRASARRAASGCLRGPRWVRVGVRRSQVCSLGISATVALMRGERWQSRNEGGRPDAGGRRTARRGEVLHDRSSSFGSRALAVSPVSGEGEDRTRHVRLALRRL